MDAVRAAYDEVHAHTMGRLGFILQHVVDAFAAQTANARSKLISVVFGLVGLYLYVEEQFSGRQVQKAHMELGRGKRAWPRVYLPEDRGSMTVADESPDYHRSPGGIPDQWVLTPLGITEICDSAASAIPPV